LNKAVNNYLHKGTSKKNLKYVFSNDLYLRIWLLWATDKLWNISTWLRATWTHCNINIINMWNKIKISLLLDWPLIGKL